MILTDSHLHTKFSTDSDCPMEQMVKTAISKGFTSICFTDHMDYDFPNIGLEGKNGFPPFCFSVADYHSQITVLRQKFASSIEILQGIELGLKTSLIERYQKLVNSEPFDYVIGSIHLVKDQDPYYSSFWEGREVSETIQEYFEATLANVSLAMDYDALGHLDYVIRYAPDQGTPYKPEWNRELIETILKQIIEQGKALEVNTSGYRKGLNAPNPSSTILKWYRELGGELITLGSDAHDTNSFAYSFSKCEELLKALGFSYYAYYKNRKPMMLPLS